jgi:hypothetical protein
MNTPELRSSQVVTTFGPGAMVDLPDASVIVAGLDHWHYDQNQIPVIQERRLVEKLKLIVGVPALTLRSPPPAADRAYGFRPDITAWRFPEWFIVQLTQVTAAGFRRRRLVHLNSLDGGKYRDAEGKKQSVVPVRFVRACKKGHVGDIDWRAFVHGTGPGLACPRDLWMEERGTTGDLDEIWVVCDCGKQRPMAQAARMELRALGSCNGSRPWLGPGTKEACGEPNRLLIRSASNAYFPQLMSVISIPDAQTAVDEVVQSAWDAGLSIVDSPEKLAMVRQIPTIAVKLQGLEDAAILAAIKRVRHGGSGVDRPVKEVEFEALAEVKEELGSDVPDGDFFARTLPKAQWNAAWMSVIERVVLVHRLREVFAQVGFTRFEAAGPDIQGELSLDVKRAPLGIDASWLPAVENRGEGIFIQFRSQAVAAWLQKTAVRKRGDQLAEGFMRWKAEHEGSTRKFSGLPYIMLHSLAHLLLTAMSLECGYPASSLRERVYVPAEAGTGGYGILIYTGSSDAEGTLGGLVMAGRDISRHMRRALECGELCSNDPVCAHHVPARHDGQQLLGSACHGCLLIAETSCEQRNEFLDRALVVPTVEAIGAEFFAPVI